MVQILDPLAALWLLLRDFGSQPVMILLLRGLADLL